MATTCASSYNINFRGCSKFVSGAVFLSRKCAKACNRRNFSLLQKFFFGQPNVNLLTSQFSSVALPPVTCSNPPGPTKSLEKLLGARKVFPTPFPRSHVRTRLVPQKPREPRILMERGEVINSEFRFSEARYTI